MAFTSKQIKQLNNMNAAAQRAGLGTFLGKMNGTSTVLTGSSLSTTRQLDSEATFTPTSSFSISGGGSFAAIRGGLTVSASKSFTDGFLYGAQGKVTLNGIIAEVSAARIAGALGQVDLASGTVTAGQVSGVWADLQGSPTLTVPDQVFPLRVTNSMSVNAYAMAFFYGKASYFMEVGEPSPSFVSSGAATPSGTMKKLKVNIGGSDLYILAAATWS